METPLISYNVVLAGNGYTMQFEDARPLEEIMAAIASDGYIITTVGGRQTGLMAGDIRTIAAKDAPMRLVPTIDLRDKPA